MSYPHQKVNMPIRRFEGRWAFLSNFYVGKPLMFAGMKWQTAEHAYQAQKTVSAEERMDIQECTSPGRAKRKGKEVRIRSGWDKIRVPVMTQVERRKYEDPYLREKLLSTGNRTLIEGNYHHDNFWGDCRCTGCREIVGENWLGKILMAERERIREEMKAKAKAEADIEMSEK